MGCQVKYTEINFRLLLIYLLSVCIFSSCSKNSQVITREEVLQSFSVIHLHSISEIILVQDTCYKIVAEGDEAVVKNLCWDVQNDTIIINDNSASVFRITDIPRITVHFPEITWLTAFKPARITNTDTIRLDFFYIYSIGEIGEVNLILDCATFGLDNSANTLGKFFIKGRADLVYFFNRYGSSIIADSLICHEAQVINESVGDVYINAEELLKVFLWGTGNIYYHGNPEISIIEKRNTGEVIRLDHYR